MLVSEYILHLRRFAKDLEVLTRDSWDGDGSTVAFRTKHTPILNSTVTVKTSGTPQADSLWTLDLDTGILEFATAPVNGSDNVTLDYKYTNLRDQEWLEVIQNVINKLREKTWTEEIDESTLTTVKGQDDYDLSGVDANIFKVLGLWYKTSSSSNTWISFSLDTNFRFMVEQNTINMRPPFDIDGYEMRIRILKFFSPPTLVTETLSVSDRFLTTYDYFCIVEYLDRLQLKMVTDLGGKTTEATYKTLTEIGNLRQRMNNEAEARLSRIRPIVPSTKIPTIHQGIVS